MADYIYIYIYIYMRAYEFVSMCVFDGENRKEKIYTYIPVYVRVCVRGWSA